MSLGLLAHTATLASMERGRDLTMIERFEFIGLGAGNVRLENWLSLPRQGTSLLLGEGHGADPAAAGPAPQNVMTITPCTIHHAHSQMGRTILVRAVFDGHDLELVCDMALAQALVVHGFGEVDQGLLASRERALVLEHALGGPIAMLERETGSLVTFHWAAPDIPPDLAQFGAVSVRLDNRGRAGHAILHGTGFAAEAFRGWVETCGPAPRNAMSPLVDLAFLFGATTLSMSELRDLEIGDTVLIDDTFSVETPLRVVAGKLMVAEARFSGKAIEAMTRFSPFRGGQGFRWMIEPLDGVHLDMNDATHIATNQLGDMKVKLVFEVGRAEMSVGEIEKLGPGYVFQVSRASDGHVDVIAGGRVIGSGELVKIGDDIGVRLKRIAT